MTSPETSAQRSNLDRAASSVSRTRATSRGIPEATVARLPVYLRALAALADERRVDGLVRGARRRRRGQLRQAAQGPLPPRVLRHPRRRLRRRVPRLPDLPRARPHPGLVGRHRRRRQPRPRARQLRRLRLPRLPRSPRWSTPTRRWSASAIAGLTVAPHRRARRRSSRHRRAPSASSPRPAAAAQSVCDRLVGAGVTSILNFAPTVLSVPDGVDVRKVDLSIELQILSFHEQRKAARRRSRPSRAGAGDGRRERPRRRPVAPHRPGRPARARRTAPATRSPSCCADVLASDHAARRSCSRPATGSRSTPTSTGSTPASPQVTELLARQSGVALDELTPHLYVHYEDRAVPHLFSVACGLDSMVVGEGQILGQVRVALRAAQDAGSAGRAARRAVPAGAAGRQAGPHRDRHRPRRPLAGHRRPGAWPAGSSARWPAPRRSSSAPARWARWPPPSLAQAGAAQVVVANRTPERAERLAASVGGEAVPLTELARGAGRGRPRRLVHRRHRPPAVGRAAGRRGRRAAPDRPLVVLDLALPRDVDPAVAPDPRRHARRPRVAARRARHQRAHRRRRGDPRDRRRGGRGVPRLAARGQRRADRGRAARHGRRGRRRPSWTGSPAGCRSSTPARGPRSSRPSRRVVDKLLHAPTVRVKELAEEPGGAVLRRRAARAVRARPGGRRGCHPGRRRGRDPARPEPRS